MIHSPFPWKLVPSPIPYSTWIMDATGGCVCIGFGQTDEAILLAAPTMLTAIRDAAVAMDQGQIVRARSLLADALAVTQ